MSSTVSERALSSDNVLSLAAKCLDSNAPNLKKPWEAVAVVSHACMLAVDFRLIGHGEGESEQKSQLLPAEWSSNSTAAFTYAHAQSSMQHVLKISELGNRVIIYGLALGHDKTASFDVALNDFISPSALPLSPSNNLPQTLGGVFISPARLRDFIALFKLNVIQKLTPGLQKDGYEDTREETTREEHQRLEHEQRRPRDPLRDDHVPQPARPYPFDDPLAAAPRRPIPAGDFPPPGFEDEYEINQPPRGYPPGGHGERRPLNIGERDLYPPGLGPHDPLRPHLAGPLGGGGMHPTFDDPMFGGTGEQQGGFDPQVPPGARYDPVGPGDGRPFGRGGGPRPPGGGFGGFGGGFGGDII